MRYITTCAHIYREFYFYFLEEIFKSFFHERYEQTINVIDFIVQYYQGRIQDFHLGGGGRAKIMCSNAHYNSTFGRGPGPA